MAFKTVVCAVILDSESRILLAKRKGPVLSGWWEFPGGKVEGQEDPKTALKREMYEELEVDSEIGDFLFENDVEIEGKMLRLLFYSVSLINKDFKLNVHTDIQFFSRDELDGLNILEGDRPFLEFFKGRIAKKI